MEYVFLIGGIILFFIAVFFLEWNRARQAKKTFEKNLYENYGKLSEKKYSPERFARMDSYFRRHSRPGQIDDITWNDLEMDELFRRMNYTLSALGEEYLYHTLRTPKQDIRELEHFEEVVKFFGEHANERVRLQQEMHRLGYMGKYSLYDYLDNLDYLGERSNKRHLLCDFLFLPFFGMLWINFSVGIIGIVILTIYNIVSYFKEKNDIDPYITSFAYVMRLLEVCGRLEKHPIPVCGGEWEQMKRHADKMQGLRRNSFWVMSNAGGNSAGDIASLVMDYIRMVFHVDLIKFNRMLRLLRGHMEDVDILIGTVGYLETAVAVWIFRESLQEGYCLPDFSDTRRLLMEEGYHPLLKHPVKNSIDARRGVLLTGSNASGKSTFLKTVAVNAILSQTVNTCPAKSYHACFFDIYSSMALRDDMKSGESYYIVEIKSLKRILDGAGANGRPVLCFVDEVLRGTNTVERIAASTQILKALGSGDFLCFAATHDIELTELLSDEFDNYHFEEEVRDSDVVFPYKLLAGKAVTRNAIKLLEAMGYPREIIAGAESQAGHFISTGKWEPA
jgi:hypothetical protein